MQNSFFGDHTEAVIGDSILAIAKEAATNLTARNHSPARTEIVDALIDALNSNCAGRAAFQTDALFTAVLKLESKDRSRLNIFLHGWEKAGRLGHAHDDEHALLMRVAAALWNVGEESAFVTQHKNGHAGIIANSPVDPEIKAGLFTRFDCAVTAWENMHQQNGTTPETAKAGEALIDHMRGLGIAYQALNEKMQAPTRRTITAPQDRSAAYFQLAAN